MIPDAPQSAIQSRANAQRDRFGPQISLDSILLPTPLCSATDRVGLDLADRNAIWMGLACGVCTLIYVPRLRLFKPLLDHG